MSRKFRSKFEASTIMTIFRPLRRFAMDLHAYDFLNAVQTKLVFKGLNEKRDMTITSFGFATGRAYASLDC